ncbi:MAG: YqaE/Pmp3 family membrane protein [Bacteroidaceae bacterium]|nr:YqaE/Pmp3 family membrane protein [Bacteroidaceae bacterium]
MSCLRALAAVICPPIAVIDKGCGAFALTTLLTCAGWVPGVLAAILFNTKK